MTSIAVVSDLWLLLPLAAESQASGPRPRDRTVEKRTVKQPVSPRLNLSISRCSSPSTDAMVGAGCCIERGTRRGEGKASGFLTLLGQERLFL